MYARPPRRPPNVRVPENYSGCAFSEPLAPDLPPRYVDVAKPTPELPPPREEKPMPPPPILPVGHGLPLSEGLSFDQLLLLGLILLLMREGGESDAVLSLALLLFCN